MNIKQENLDKLEQLQQDLAAQAQGDQPGQDPEQAQAMDPEIQEGKETLKQAIYLFAEMGNTKLSGLHERMGVPEDKLSTASNLLGEAISKHIKIEYLEHSVEAAAGLYIGTLALQQYRIYTEVREEIIQAAQEDQDQQDQDQQKPEINTQQ